VTELGDGLGGQAVGEKIQVGREAEELLGGSVIGGAVMAPPIGDSAMGATAAE